MGSLSTLTALLFSGLLYYGAFSRLTHGQHTPDFYAHQIARQADDGSSTATIVPWVDVILATLMLLGSRSVKRLTAIIAGSAQGVGLVVVLKNGLDVTPDLGVLAVCLLALVGASL